MGLGPGGDGSGDVSALPLDSPAAQQHDPLVWLLLCELQRLTVALAPTVRDVLVGDYEELWTGVVIRWAALQLRGHSSMHWPSGVGYGLGTGQGGRRGLD